MTKSLREQLADLRRFAKAHPEVRDQVRLVMVAAKYAEKRPHSVALQNLLQAQLKILQKQMLDLSTKQ